MDKTTNMHKILNLIGFLTIGLAMSLILYYGWLYQTEERDWFHYISISTDHKVYEPGVEISMTSNLIRPKHIRGIRRMTFNEILHCDILDDDRGTFFYSSQFGGVDSPPAIEQYENRPWAYTADTPKRDADCYIDTTVVATLDFGVEKEQKLQSGPFHIRD